MSINTITVTDASSDELFDLGLSSVDWKASPEEVLERVHNQLAEHGLAIDLYDAGDDSVAWVMRKATACEDERDDRGEKELGDLEALRRKWTRLADGVQGMGGAFDVNKLTAAELNADIEFLKGGNDAITDDEGSPGP